VDEVPMAGLAEAYTVMLQGLRLVNAPANRAQGALSSILKTHLCLQAID
jgi:hypothetical protein